MTSPYDSRLADTPASLDCRLVSTAARQCHIETPTNRQLPDLQLVGHSLPMVSILSRTRCREIRSFSSKHSFKAEGKDGSFAIPQERDRSGPALTALLLPMFAVPCLSCLSMHSLVVLPPSRPTRPLAFARRLSSETYLQNILTCASCNSANNNVGSTVSGRLAFSWLRSIFCWLDLYVILVGRNCIDGRLDARCGRRKRRCSSVGLN